MNWFTNYIQNPLQHFYPYFISEITNNTTTNLPIHPYTYPNQMLQN